MKKILLRLLCLGFIIFPSLSFISSPGAERPWRVQSYITKFRYLAVELNQKTGIPVPLILAVAGLESDWGTSDLALYSNNHFGIKAKDWTGFTYCKYTPEYLNGSWVEVMECFRKYALIRDSYFDFGNFLLTRPNYRYLFGIPQENIEDWAWGLWYCNYATDPDYSEKLLRLIAEYQLE